MGSPLRIALLLVMAACGSSPPPGATARPPSPEENSTGPATHPVSEAVHPVYIVPRRDPAQMRRRCASTEPENGSQDIAMSCAVLACDGRDAAMAHRWIVHMKSPSRRGMAREACRKNGVIIAGD